MNTTELVTEAELSQILRRSRRQLQRDRAMRCGCPYVQIGAQVRYRRDDVDAYIAQRVVGATASAPTPKADTACSVRLGRAG